MNAHIDNADEIKYHSLKDHLEETAKLASSFARSFNSEQWAHIGAICHDIGKYNQAFQDYLSHKCGLTNIPYPKTEHAVQGALFLKQFTNNKCKELYKIFDCLIACHHTGLQDYSHLNSRFDGKDLHFLKGNVFASELSKNIKIPNNIPCKKISELHLWIRMLFSCVVDADFLDTEYFYDNNKRALRASNKNIVSLKELLNKSFNDRDESLKLSDKFNSPINKVRRDILEQCNNASKEKPGFFTLQVPTGGGKTLSSMSFALNHAVFHGKERVITVIPYTSIIEQTSQILKNIFGELNVLEHHSNIDIDNVKTQNKLASENWDAPIIVTTNVQFFESLLASRTSQCRKIHNIANSVIILDEAQMLPVEFLYPVLDVLKTLVTVFKCTVVICTATQPVLSGTIGEQSVKFSGIDEQQITPIIKNPIHLFESLKRTNIIDKTKEIQCWRSLTDEIIKNKQSLTVVNRRRDCRELWDILSEKSNKPIHLSALMCGQHRADVIDLIKSKLNNHEDIHVVSTQIVEAGVDIDFPVVFRSIGGLDSIAQAAGRCNREGKLAVGNVYVFRSPKPSPVGLLRKGENTTSKMSSLDITPDNFLKYFKNFYGNVNDFGEDTYKEYLCNDAGKLDFNFKSASDWFKLIDDEKSKSIVVLYESNKRSSFDIICKIKKNGFNRYYARLLQRFIVNVPNDFFEKLKENNYIEKIDDIWVQVKKELYNNDFGVDLDIF